MDLPGEQKASFGNNEDSTAGEVRVSESNPLLVYVQMPVDLDPDDRTELFADPLQEALEKEGLGTVTGGGSMLSAPDEDGERETEFCGIDVDLYDLERGFALLRRELLRLEAPQGQLSCIRLTAEHGRSRCIAWKARGHRGYHVAKVFYPRNCIKLPLSSSPEKGRKSLAREVSSQILRIPTRKAIDVWNILRLPVVLPAFAPSRRTRAQARVPAAHRA